MSDTFMLVIFFFVRLLFAVIQTGYIHPDEFMQSTEITGGDIFSFKATRTWEWNSEAPLRSVTFPYIFSGIIFILVKHSGLAISSWTLLAVSRLWMAAISSFTDILLFKLSKIFGHNFSSSNMLFSSSYVTLVFMTRTFSNPVELLFFTALLFLAVDRKSNTSKWIERFLPFMLSFGLFARPTFLLFALVPLIAWTLNLPRLTFQKFINNAIQKLFWMLPLFLLSCLAIATLDSIYHGTVDVHKIDYNSMNSEFLLEILKNISWTPVNFIKYNGNNVNLVKHGLHPWYFHLLFNVPLLFGAYGFIGVIVSFKEIFKFIRARLRNYKRTNTRFIVAFSALVPLALLSIFPHHEARYILPLVIPLILLSADQIYLSNILFTVNVIHSLLGLIIMGLFHQGGVTPSTHHLAAYFQANPVSDARVIFYNTYMPPKHLLMVPKTSKIEVLDFAGLQKDKFITSLESKLKSNPVSETFLVVPYPTSKKLNLSKGFKIEIIYSFFPHLSIESPPNATELLQCNNDIYEFLKCFKSQFSLTLMRISLSSAKL